MLFKSYASPEILVPVVVLSVIIMCFIIFYIWRRIRLNGHKKSQLEALTSKPSTSHMYTGVKASHTIEFIVPTVTLKCSEPSFSVTEESDSDCLQLANNYDHNGMRKRNSRIQINENEISKSLYEEVPQLPQQSPEISFVLHYSFVRQQLLVTLLSAKNLYLKRSHLNPFAKVVLLPEKNPKLLTKVKKNTTNPVFNELFIFQAQRNTLDDRVLKITVYSSDSFSRKNVIGRVVFPLKTADIDSNISRDVMTEDITCLLRESKPFGELLLSLNYETNSSTLTLGALKVRHIFDKEIQTIYMKVVLFVKRKRIKSRKTSLHRVETEINFDDMFHVNVAKETLNDLIISISVYGKSNTYVNKHILGRTHVGQLCPSAQGIQHWTEMCLHYNETISQWHIFS
ncbi:synaptotagmin-11-like [Oppia nitens]|uniref:synaptotagmin-11-like n=1 Tax=Oppia nitens TaxID=1686743 RepID=UPI0023DB0C43|nr:synaptotagmin-11-like [Oppia nitens]